MEVQDKVVLDSSISRFIIRPYQNADRELWDSFCNSNRAEVDFTYHRSYLEYRYDQLTDASLVLQVSGASSLCGVIPLAVLPHNKDEIVTHPYLTFGGLVVSNSIDIITYLELLERILVILKAQGYISISYRFRPSVYEDTFSSAAQYLLRQKSRYSCKLRLSSVIDLSHLASSSRRRRALNKATKNGLLIRRLGADIEGFWTLLKNEIACRYNTTLVHRYEDFKKISAAFVNNILCYGVFKSEELVAGAVIYAYSDVWKLQYSFSSIKGRELLAIDWLYSNLFRNARLEGVRYFDLGPSASDQEKFSVQRNLFEFKMGFGCRLYNYETGRLEL